MEITDEVEMIQCMYPELEIDFKEEERKLRVPLQPAVGDADGRPPLYLAALSMSFPEEYPEKAPSIAIEGLRGLDHTGQQQLESDLRRLVEGEDLAGGPCLAEVLSNGIDAITAMNEKPTCLITLNAIPSRDDVFIAPCTHAFHRAAFARWAMEMYERSEKSLGEDDQLRSARQRVSRVLAQCKTASSAASSARSAVQECLHRISDAETRLTELSGSSDPMSESTAAMLVGSIAEEKKRVKGLERTSERERKRSEAAEQKLREAIESLRKEEERCRQSLGDVPCPLCKQPVRISSLGEDWKDQAKAFDGQWRRLRHAASGKVMDEVDELERKDLDDEAEEDGGDENLGEEEKVWVSRGLAAYEARRKALVYQVAESRKRLGWAAQSAQ